MTLGRQKINFWITVLFWMGCTAPFRALSASPFFQKWRWLTVVFLVLGVVILLQYVICRIRFLRLYQVKPIWIWLRLLCFGMGNLCYALLNAWPFPLDLLFLAMLGLDFFWMMQEKDMV